MCRPVSVCTERFWTNFPNSGRICSFRAEIKKHEPIFRIRAESVRLELKLKKWTNFQNACGCVACGWRSSEVLGGPRRSSAVGVFGGPRMSSEVLGGPRRSSEVLGGPRNGGSSRQLRSACSARKYPKCERNIIYQKKIPKCKRNIIYQKKNIKV